MAIVVTMFSISIACDSSANTSRIVRESPMPEVILTDIEKDIKSMETANFEYIFVFRRKDGGMFDGKDKSYLKANSPADTNRFVLSDNEKAVVAGSSYEFSDDQLEKLGERFSIENHSTAKTDENANLTETEKVQDLNKPIGNN